MKTIAAGSWDVRKCVRDGGQLKTGWRTQREAERAAERVRGSPGYVQTPGEELTAYQCPVCGLWHTGNTPVRKGRP